MLKNIFIILMKALISIGLIWVALSSVDIEAAVNRARQVNPTMLALTIIILFFQAGLGGLRWHSVSKVTDAGLSIFNSFRLFYIGMFFNQVLPGGTSGDVVRVYLAFKTGLSLRGAINSVMLERLITVVALMLLVSLTQPFFSGRVVESDFDWGIGFSILVFSFTALSIGFLMILDRLPQRLKQWKFFRGLGYLGEDTRKIFLEFRNLLPIMLLGFLTHINFSFCAYTLAVGLDLNISFFYCFALMPPIMLITTIPLTIGGWGVRENAMIIGFGLIGISSDAALALSVLLGLVGLFTTLPGGLVWLFSRERKQKFNFLDATKELKAEKYLKS